MILNILCPIDDGENVITVCKDNHEAAFRTLLTASSSARARYCLDSYGYMKLDNGD